MHVHAAQMFDFYKCRDFKQFLKVISTRGLLFTQIYLALDVEHVIVSEFFSHFILFNHSHKSHFMKSHYFFEVTTWRFCEIRAKIFTFRFFALREYIRDRPPDAKPEPWCYYLVLPDASRYKLSRAFHENSCAFIMWILWKFPSKTLYSLKYVMRIYFSSFSLTIHILLYTYYTHLVLHFTNA